MIFIWRACGEPDVPTTLQTRTNGLEEDDYRYVPYNRTFTYLDPMFLQEFGSHGGSCTRIMIVNMLWRLDGRPEPVNAQAAFTDVKWSDTTTSRAVAWAVEQGITSGTGGTFFSPNDVCTRAQIMTFLQRYFERA